MEGNPPSLILIVRPRADGIRQPKEGVGRSGLP